MIFFSKSAQIKSFLSSAGLSATAERYLTSLIIAFLLHWGRMTASQAASAVRIHPRHRANVARFLSQSGVCANWLECFTYATVLLEQEYRREGIWLFILDETCCSQQGTQTENTFSTGNRVRRPQKRRRHSKKRYVRKTVHAFVIGLLITPGGLRLPHLKCYFTKDYAAQKQVPHRTQAQLGADLISAVKVPESARVIVLGDTAYDVQVVASCVEKPSVDQPIPLSKVLITNDMKLKTQEILVLYSLRWQIELLFKELKSSLGMHQYRFRQFEKVAAWVQAALLAFVYLEWLCARKLRDGRLDAASKRWWRMQRTHGLCRAVRLHAEQKELLELARHTKTTTGLHRLRKLLHDAQPIEYRRAC